MTEQNLISFIFKALSGTPTWVWFVFGYLIFIGIRALNDRVVYIPTLLIIPIVLAGMKYQIFLGGTLMTWVSYFACLGSSTFLSFKMATKQKVQIISERFEVKLPGNYSTLVILMSFFAVKYFFGYMNATQPDLYRDLSIVEIGISGIFSGYFLGKAINYLNCYMRLIR